MATIDKELEKSLGSAKETPGKRYYFKHLSGETLTYRQSIIAECFSCTAGYADGRVDCLNPRCALYPHMPYRKRPKKEKAPRTEKQIEHDRRLSLLRSKSNTFY